MQLEAIRELTQRLARRLDCHRVTVESNQPPARGTRAQDLRRVPAATDRAIHIQAAIARLKRFQCFAQQHRPMSELRHAMTISRFGRDQKYGTLFGPTLGPPLPLVPARRTSPCRSPS